MTTIKLSEDNVLEIGDDGSCTIKAPPGYWRHDHAPYRAVMLSRDETNALTSALYEHRDVSAALAKPAVSLASARIELRSYMWLTHQVTLSVDDEITLCGLVRAILEAEEENRKRVQEKKP